MLPLSLFSSFLPRLLLLVVVSLLVFSSACSGSSSPWPRAQSPSAAALAALNAYEHIPVSSHGTAFAVDSDSARLINARYEDAHAFGAKFAAMTRQASRRAVELAAGVSTLHLPAAPRVKLAAAAPAPANRKIAAKSVAALHYPAAPRVRLANIRALQAHHHQHSQQHQQQQLHYQQHHTRQQHEQQLHEYEHRQQMYTLNHRLNSGGEVADSVLTGLERASGAAAQHAAATCTASLVWVVLAAAVTYLC